MVRSIRLLFFFGWGFSTTQQPSLCQNSLIFPDGSSFGPLPKAPEGSCFVANLPVLTLRCNNTRGSLNWMGLEKVEVLETGSRALKVGVSDPGPLTAPARDLGRQAGTGFCLL